MNLKHFKKQYDRNKTLHLYKIIDSINIENANYREIFDNAVQYTFGEPLVEYYEKDIDAIMVNNIRHNYSNYDQYLKPMHRINRCDKDYIQYKNSVLEKISNIYPSLKNECDKQKRKCNMVKII